ncbi:hypothetical protein D0A34_26820 [Microcoleus vaginatus PCC 9802]|nr:hypothetical protein MicvaDRAFT_0997 [Microcoleus vaginatus FGP-2]UNU21974.1 hypothetical protein D0A34_26820 [Microcoleus vaginatus PCC 9802]
MTVPIFDWEEKILPDSGVGIFDYPQILKSLIQNLQDPGFISGALVRGTMQNLKSQIPKCLALD